MQLKQLRLLGFKTFADKTEINIDAGMTAIVGPNGSGKSNIVDGLLWVLGEQNPRLMRGTTSQDVIFSGTDKRKPLGMAEVKLTVDNSDGTLPIEFAEVVITRRIYRSGESQYLLNNAPCRLKDIIELFLDTGVGKGAYSFVSQTEIDAVLSARPEDRRELFEEAAGIKKYRVKKRDALRKLENAEGNLTRVRDILTELDVEREPLERQSMAARRFLLLQERLHQIEVGLLVAELQKADYELYAGQQERTQDQAALLTYDTQLAHLERQSSEIGAVITHTEMELEAARIQQQNGHTAVERIENRLTLIAERGASAGRNRDQLTIDLKEIAARIETLTDSIEFDRTERAEVDVAESARREEWAGQKASLVELEAAVAEAVRQAEERQGERVRLAQERAARESSLKSASERLIDIVQRADRAVDDAGRLALNLNDARAREVEARTAREDLARRRECLTESVRSAESDIQRTRAALTAARTNLDGSRRLQAEQSSRLSTLTELQENHEGFYQGVKAILNARKRREIEGHFTPVVDLLTVPERYRVAIEVALGGSLQDIVTRTESEAKAGIEWLKRNRAGRATFLPLPLLRPGTKTEVAGRARGWSGDDVLNASDIVSCSEEYDAVTRLLLGRVLVVNDMDTAISTSRSVSGWSKIVTLEGELLTPGGALTGGSLQGKGAHLIGRKGEIDDLRTALPNTRKEVERLTQETDLLITSIQKTEDERSSLAREEASVQAQLAGMETARTSAEREDARLKLEVADREQVAEQLNTQAAALRTEVKRLSDALESGKIENDQAATAIAALTDETRALITRRDECRSRAVALEVEVSRLKEKREGLTRSIASDRAALVSLEQQQAQKIRQRDSTDAEGLEAVAERTRLTGQLEEARKHVVIVDAEFAEWQKKRQTQLTESSEIGARLKELAQRRAEVTQNLHETELRLARLEIQITQATERLQEEYGISREDALARPEDTSIDKNTAMEVGRLRRELRGMGTVNTGAVAEYERLTERHEFLSTQKTDLERGQASLLATIAEIDESTRGVFMETFEAVKVEFQKIFVRLFDGGSTKLVLTTPDDLLETGIDVIAQPPGKKPQHLSLLSGGERALTATALLFAFLAVKPSPFVLLDEVDAPLDGSNVEKFTELVRDFSQRSQFLLITHNPVTMEAAPTWYGVTMREAGVTSILSYRVPQESTPSDHDTTVVISS